MDTILITGATGFVGTYLTNELLKRNYKVHILSRNIEKAKELFKHKNAHFFQWNAPYEVPPQEAYSQVQGIINLSGENIASKRWTKNQKKAIYDSRIIGTENLIQGINNYKLDKMKFFISTSAIGYYEQDSQGKVLDENSPAGSGFLAHVCQNWENELSEVINCDRKVILRVGIVLGKEGGALSKMLPLFKWGLGGRIGSGEQWMSWIHVKDLVKIYLEAIENSAIVGVVNAVSPNPVTNKHFTKILARVLSRPAFFHVPSFVIKLAMGELSALVLDNQKIAPERLLKESFQFDYPNLKEALTNIVE